MRKRKKQVAKQKEEKEDDFLDWILSIDLLECTPKKRRI